MRDDAAEPLPASKGVRIFASEADFDAISIALGFSEFQACPTPAPLAASAGSLSTPVAAIVSDRVDHPVELCRALGASMPVILLSSEPDFGFRLDAARAGVRAILGRPVDQVELLQCLGDIGDTLRVDPVSVVIVDDDIFGAELNAEILRAAGMDVEIVNDPRLAFEVIQRTRPDLILMDLQMPQVNGAELAQVIRLSRDLVSIPIVFLSAERNENRQIAARLQGGDDFIQKPINSAHLIAQVQLKASRAKALRSIIERDGLTGLLDHRRFGERLAHDWVCSRRDKSDLCLVMIDVDHFKAVNDTYGHPIGDKVLRTLAQVLTSSLRRSDTVGRCGGEEFGVILRGANLRSALKLIGVILERFGALSFQAGSVGFSVTFSAGISSSAECLDISDLLAAADRALYASKAAGRNQVRGSAADDRVLR